MTPSTPNRAVDTPKSWEARFRDLKAKSAARKVRRADNARFQAEATGGKVVGKVGVKKPKTINRTIQMKRLKKSGLVKWSLAVRARDGHKCLMCDKTEYMQAHHWLFRKAHSVRLALDPANGSTLCYGCHIGRIHRDGDGEFMMQLFERMISIVGQAKVDEMRWTGRNPTPVSLEELQIAVEKL